MYRLVERRPLWFLLSLVGILPGIIFMLWNLTSSGAFLPLSIDYTGGTQWEMRFNAPVAPTEVGSVFVDAGFTDTKAFLVDDDRTVQVKFKNIDISQKELIAQAIVERFGEFDERLYRSIGPAIGGEVSRAALLAVIAAAILILAYIAFAFREVSHPFRYGVAAIVALIHDVLITVSFLSIMNLIAGWELDALFLTATLTVIGFSVNDTIVIFDRIRENLRRHRGEPLATVANRSIIETAQALNRDSGNRAPGPCRHPPLWRFHAAHLYGNLDCGSHLGHLQLDLYRHPACRRLGRGIPAGGRQEKGCRQRTNGPGVIWIAGIPGKYPCRVGSWPREESRR